MPYGITDEDVQAVSAKLEAEYEERRDVGILNVMDRMTTGGIDTSTKAGLIQKKIALASTSVTSFKREFDLSFNVPLKNKLMTELRVQTGNSAQLASIGVTVAVTALKQVLKKFVPFGGVAAAGLGAVAKLATGELNERAVKETDKQMSGRTGTELHAMTSTERDIGESAEAAADLYKEIGKLVTASPPQLTTFDDIIVYPGLAWKLTKAASSLNIALDGLTQYFRQMEARVDAVQKALTDARKKIREGMNEEMHAVLRKCYDEGTQKGVTDYNAQNYTNFAEPARKIVSESGAAPHLAMLMAWAFASGYFDGPRTITRTGRSAAVTSRPQTGPPLPPRPTRPLPPTPVAAPPPPMPSWSRVTPSGGASPTTVRFHPRKP